MTAPAFTDDEAREIVDSIDAAVRSHWESKDGTAATLIASMAVTLTTVRVWKKHFAADKVDMSQLGPYVAAFIKEMGDEFFPDLKAKGARH